MASSYFCVLKRVWSGVLDTGLIYYHNKRASEMVCVVVNFESLGKFSDKIRYIV